MRTALGVGILLAAAGLGLAVVGSRDARRMPVAPLEYGIQFFIPPAPQSPPAEGKVESTASAAEEPPPPAAEKPATAPHDAAASIDAKGAQDATTPRDAAAPHDAAAPVDAKAPRDATVPREPGGPLDLKAVFTALSPEDTAAVAKAIEPSGPTATLPLGVMLAVQWLPPGSLAMPRSIILCVVDDADADRLLAPLIVKGDRMAPLLAATDAPLSVVFADKRFPKGAADVPAARLPDSVRCLGDMILVRRSAASRVGLEPKSPAPNMLVVTFGRPGVLEEVMRLAEPLWKSRRITVRPIDLALGYGSAARWMGAAALALMLAGGSLLAACGVAALGRRGGTHHDIVDRVLAGARLVNGHRAEYARVLALLTAALVVGGAWGGPEPLGDLLRENGAGPLARVGLESAELGTAQLGDFLLNALLGNVLLRALLVIGLPGLVPGLGLVTAAVHNVIWGVALAPSTLTLLDRLPLRAVVTVLEGQAYALMALGGWRVLAGVLWPGAVGERSRKAGYSAGLSELYRVIPLAAVVLLVAALVETGIVAAMSWWM